MLATKKATSHVPRRRVLEHSNMTSTGTRKRARDAEDEDCYVLLGGSSGHCFAAGRMDNHANKRTKLSMPAPISPVDAATMSSMVTVEEGRPDSSICSVGWQEHSSGMSMGKGVALNSFAGLTSPPLSPPPTQGLALQPQSTHPTSTPVIPQPSVHDSGGPRIVRFNPVSEELDESDDEGEPYDPEEVSTDIGSEGDDENEGTVGMMESAIGGGQPPLLRINAFLHEIHFSNRRQRLDRLALDHCEPFHVSRTASPAKQTHAGSSASNITTLPSIASPHAASAAAVAGATAVRPENKLWNESQRTAPVKIPQPSPVVGSDERSSVGSQYEETNRYDFSHVKVIYFHSCVSQITRCFVSKSKKAEEPSRRRY